MNTDKVSENCLETVPQTKEYGILKWNPPCVVSKPKKEKIAGKGFPCQEVSESEEDSDEEVERHLIKLLNSLIKRKEWRENGQIWQQFVSSDPATREDVIKLADQLDGALTENSARDTGICDVRRSIYSELFDELIREEGVVCVERGSMLVTIRDEIYRTLGVHQNLYISSMAYGIRKDLEGSKLNIHTITKNPEYVILENCPLLVHIYWMSGSGGVYGLTKDSTSAQSDFIAKQLSGSMIPTSEPSASVPKQNMVKHQVKNTYKINYLSKVEEEKKKLENEIEELKLTLDKSKNEFAYLAEKYEITEKQYEEMSKLNEEKHQSVMEFFNVNNQILNEKLVSFLLAKK